MKCSLCGGHVEWQGRLSNLTHTKCLSCNAINAQEVDPPQEDEADELDTATGRLTVTSVAKIRLDFMVDPVALKTQAFVPDPVRIIVTDPESIFITGILGESGRKLVAAGIVFIMTRPLAERLIAHGVAIKA